MVVSSLLQARWMFAGSLVWLAACGGGNNSDAQADGSTSDMSAQQDDGGVQEDGSIACATSLPQIDCESISQPPTDPDGIADFINANAIPLRCGDQWNIQPIVEAFGDEKVFAFGEMHGTNEIGILSGQIFHALASRDQVNVVAMELPMDFDAAFQAYVDTGTRSLPVQYMLDNFAPNFFGHVLIEDARQLTIDGHPIRVGLVDSPYGTVRQIGELQEIAAMLTEHRDLVLDDLPAPIDVTTDIMTDEYKAAAKTYANGLIANRDTICSELPDDQCDRLEAMAHAIWVAASLTGNSVADPEWSERREKVIYYNQRAEMTSDSDRMYLHMGAFHTNKAAASSGSMLSSLFQRTRGHVISMAASYGPDSQIYYGRVMSPGDPMSADVTNALADREEDPIFVSTTRPSPECVRNPFYRINQDFFGTPTTLTYDGYLHIRRFTPETQPEDSTLPASTDFDANQSSMERALHEQMQRIIGAWKQRRGLMR